ncbi:MAG: hypothetical protein ACI4AD_01950 [Roseburia sp.]
MAAREYEARLVHVSLEEKDSGRFEAEMWQGDDSNHIFFEIEKKNGEIKNLLNANREAVKEIIPDKQSGAHFMEREVYTPEEQFMLDNMDLVREEICRYYEAIGNRIAGSVHYPKAVEELPFS